MIDLQLGNSGLGEASYLIAQEALKVCFMGVIIYLLALFKILLLLVVNDNYAASNGFNIINIFLV